MLNALWQHTLLTLRLNARNRLALVYGYLIPVLFLFAFAALYRDEPRLVRQMGQLVTIGTLGGACFGMPTGLVADRERGVWRRYRLLPGSTAGLVVSTMFARFAIVATSALLQIAIAWLAFRTPLPAHPAQLAIAFVAVAFAFEGLGLVIAALADTVPAVQALGQAVFLPVIIVGGVGVPLATLPPAARVVADFLPGRYAVEALQPCVDGRGLGDRGFQLLALAVIGTAGCVAGAKLFRWDADQPLPAARRLWAVPAVAAWAAVGLVAMASGHTAPATPRVAAASRPAGVHPWDRLTDADVNAVPVTGLPPDDDTRTPVGPPDDSPVEEERDRVNQFRERLSDWPAIHQGDEAERVRTTLAAAAIADLSRDPVEGRIARVVFERLRADFPDDADLARLLAWVILHPDDGTVPTTAAEVGLPATAAESAVRERATMYAQKLLGRLLGKTPDVPPASP